jgi:DNA polymerase alpha-associated DNA helicase A
MAIESEIAAFLDRQTVLLGREREAEVQQTALLLSSCGPKLLERKGLALGALGVVSIQIGLGGKRLKWLIAYERLLLMVCGPVSLSWNVLPHTTHRSSSLPILFELAI